MLPTPSMTLPSTSLSGSSRGSCCRNPTENPGVTLHSPWYPSSSPAMIRSRVDLPAPFNPSTPILAPGYMEMLTPRSTSLSGGCTRRRSRIVKMNW